MTTIVFACLAFLSDDAETARALEEKGAKVVMASGVATSLDAADCSKWTEDEFRKLGGLARLKNLSLGAGVTDQTLALLTGLQELETFQTNLSQVTDDGMKLYAQFKKLKNLKMFHPGKAFTGTGLAYLADHPTLERLTVAGSLSFGDEGMAAAAKIGRLKELRTWHAGQTIEGVQKLKELKGLENLTLGQRLAYKPPTTLSDESIAILVELKSLKTLQLEEARLSVEALLRLKELPELKKLTLEGIDLPEAEVDRLKKELSKVDVKWTRPNEIYQKRINALFPK